MVGRCRTFHAIFAFGQHTWSNDVWHGMPSSRLIAPMLVQHRAWHDIITVILDTRLDYAGRGMPSLPLSSTQCQDMSSVACHHHHWNEHMVGQCRAQGRMTSYVRCHHFPWTTHTVGRRRLWHAIIALGK